MQLYGLRIERIIDFGIRENSELQYFGNEPWNTPKSKVKLSHLSKNTLPDTNIAPEK